MDTKQRNFFSRFLNEFWKNIIGLKPDDSIKSLSDKELYEFYRDLGWEVFPAVLCLGLILFITSTTIAAGMFNTLLKVVFGTVAVFFVLKLCWSRFKLEKQVEKEEVNCSFYTTKSGNVVSGFLVYGEHSYKVEDFSLMDGQLSELCFTLFEDEKSEITIFYLKDEGKFIKRTEEWRIKGINPSYKFINWLFFAVCIAALIALLVVPLVIVL